MSSPTSFQRVSHMNEAFGNPKGDPGNIDWNLIRNQSINIMDEFIELMKALGLKADQLKALLDARAQLGKDAFENVQFDWNRLKAVRDALCDVHVFAYGSHHLMGIDADRDMNSVVDGVMTRFIKNDEDKAATIGHHAKAGVTDVYFEGEYPVMVMKSGSDQPDAPKGKFLKAASYCEPVFYNPVG